MSDTEKIESSEHLIIEPLFQCSDDSMIQSRGRSTGQGNKSCRGFCHTRIILLLCALMLIAFGALSYSAAITKNSTYDETLHVPAGWMNLLGDFRANPEHPPLWKYWSALPHLIWPIDTSRPIEDWDSIPENPSFEWNWCVNCLYRTPDNNADELVNQSRFMMMLIAVGLGAFLIAFAWKAGGTIAAVAAGALYCFDPNFTAHGSLVTNDVSISFCMLLLIFALWRVGQQATWRRILAVGFFCGLGVIVKFSGLLFGPMILLVLLFRTFMGDWRVLGQTLHSWIARFAATIAICIVAGAISYAMIWAVYRFRYSAVPEPGHPLAWSLLVEKAQSNELYSRHPGKPVTPAERAAWHPSFITASLLYANKHHLFPEAFCFGVLHVHMGELIRPGYLMGRVSPVGWWYYFPLAALFKTPIASLVIIFIAVGMIWFKRRALWANPSRRWFAIAIGAPTLLYIGVLMGSDLDLGIRHLLPAYPPIFLLAALAAASIWRTAQSSVASSPSPGTPGEGRGEGHSQISNLKFEIPNSPHPNPLPEYRERGQMPGAPPAMMLFRRIACIALALFLIAESVAAWPNYIPFFNLACGGSRGGIHLLGDSNLDWGQDIQSLGNWRKSHPHVHLYLLYFGTADPAYYGIRYTNLPGSYIPGPPFQVPTGPGIIAASATAMQGIYLGDSERDAYAWMMHAKPIKVIGGSIYLFNYPYHGPVIP